MDIVSNVPTPHEVGRLTIEAAIALIQPVSGACIGINGEGQHVYLLNDTTVGDKLSPQQIADVEVAIMCEWAIKRTIVGGYQIIELVEELQQKRST